MATKTFTPVLGKRLRVIALDDCGSLPASGTANSVAVTSGFITLSLSAEIEDGSEILVKRADSSICVNEMTNPSFKRFTLEIEFCEVDPGIASLVTNARQFKDYANDTVGIAVSEGEISKRFSLELWTGLAGEGCASGVEEASGYLLLPHLNAGNVGDIEVDGENAVTFTMTGSFTRGQNGWSNGPFNVVQGAGSTPAKLATAADPFDHMIFLRTGLTPPPEANGLIPFLPAA